MFFSFDEDSHIDDITGNPVHGLGVPLSAWQDAVKTRYFGEKTVTQVQNHHDTLLKAMKKSNDTGDLARQRVNFSFDEDSLIDDIARNPTHNHCRLTLQDTPRNLQQREQSKKILLDLLALTDYHFTGQD